MHYRILFCLIALWCGLILQLKAENNKQITGTVIDRSSGTPIPYVNIYTKDFKIGTITNTEGRFALVFNSANPVLIFSSLGYQSKQLSAEEIISSPIIELQENTTKLAEITISTKNKNAYPYAVIDKVAKKIKATKNDEQWGKIMYRQKSTIDKEFTEYYEKFYDINYSTNGIKHMQMTQGRYAIRNDIFRDDFLYHYNYSDLAQLFTITGNNNKQFITPFQINMLKNYDLKVIAHSTLYDREVIEIEFISKVNRPALEGSVFIDIHTFDLLKLIAKVSHKALNMVSLVKNYGDKIRNFSIAYNISFRPYFDSTLVLNQLEMDINYNHIKNHQYNKRINTNIMLFLYNNEVNDHTKFSQQPNGAEKISDIQKIKNSSYDPQFWKDNPVVMRTKIEDDIIHSFEKIGAFGNMDDLVNNNSRKNLDEQKKLDLLDSLVLANQQYNQTYTREKIFCHTNRNRYMAGDTIWFKAYILEAQQLIPDPSSAVIYADLVDENSKVVNHILIQNNDGQANAWLEIPANSIPGKYRFRAYTNWMLNFQDEDIFTTTLVIENSKLALKWDIHFNGSKADNSDKIKVELALRTLEGKPIVDQQVVGLFIQSDKSIFTDTLTTNNIGLSTFQLKMNNVNSDNLIFQFRTTYNDVPLTKNYHLDIDQKIDVQFFPEGGHLMNGLTQTVACKATKQGQKPCSISGAIVDETDQLISMLHTDSTGLAVFRLTPQYGKQYKLKRFDDTSHSITYPLPNIEQRGAYLRVINSFASDSLLIEVAAIGADSTTHSDYSLIGTIRGKVYYASSLVLNNGLNSFYISKTKIPEGILQFVLINQNRTVLAERLTAINHYEELNISSVITDDEDSIRIKIYTTDEEQVPMLANLSAGINNLEEDSIALSIGIRDYLLFSSEFKDQSRSITPCDSSVFKNHDWIERICLTQPKGKFNWYHLLNDTLVQPRFDVEKNIKLRGQLTELPKRFQAEDINLSVFVNKDFPYIQALKPKHDSTFVFDICDFTGLGKAVLSATNSKGKAVKFDYIIEENLPLTSPDFYEWLSPGDKSQENHCKNIAFDYLTNNSGITDTFRNRILQEITITENSREKNYDQFAERLIDFDKMSTSEKESFLDIYDLIYQKYPAARFEYESEKGTVLKMKAQQINDMGFAKRIYEEPLYYVNDRIYDPYYDRELIRSLDINSIRSIRIAGPGSSIISSIMFIGPVEMLRGGSLAEQYNTSDSTFEDNTRTYLSNVVITTFTNDYFIAKMEGVTNSLIKGFTVDTKTYQPQNWNYWIPNLKSNPKHNPQLELTVSKSKHPRILVIQGIANTGKMGCQELLLPVK